MSKLTTLCAAMALVGSSFLQGAVASPWTVDMETSRLGFVASVMGGSQEGQFSTFDAQITFSPDDLGAARVHLDIDIASAATGQDQMDSALPTSDWFAVAEFPMATFQSTEFRHIEGDAYEMDGTLTVRDVSKDLTIPVTIAIDGDSAIANGAVDLARTEFGVGQGQFASDNPVGFSVQVVFELRASR
jgi:polyisoprenoid-binding protein YceI